MKARSHEDGESIISRGSVALWHPWQDQPGQTRALTQWHTPGFSTSSNTPLFEATDLDSFIDTISQNSLFALCRDILNTQDIPFAPELLGSSCATPFLAPSGTIPAMSIKKGRRTGLLIPARTWGWAASPDSELLAVLQRIFSIFGYQAPTPASLSEKILRATLPTPLRISRPSAMLRRAILDHHTGGRIDKAEPAFWEYVFEYDKNKAYLYHSMRVPCPFISPHIHTRPSLDKAMSYAVGWWHVTLEAKADDISPILLDGRRPIAGEIIDKWLWSGELSDCLDAGYRLEALHGGFSWTEMSGFMEGWADILWTQFEKAKEQEHPHVLEIIKTMMVGLPGRFLRSPHTYVLIPLRVGRRGDIPLCFNWHEKDDLHFSDWLMRKEPDPNCTALSPIGSYIVAEMRRELYHMMQAEAKNGRKVIRSYVDCYSLDGPTTLPCLGKGLGEYKEKRYSYVFADQNRFVGLRDGGEAEMKFPGQGPASRERLALWQKYRRFLGS